MVKYIIFDFDGTITDSVSLWARLFTQTLEKYGVFTSEEAVKEAALGKRYGIVSLGLEKNKVEEFYKRVVDDNRDEILKTPLISGVEKVINRLQKNGYNLSINTSSDSVRTHKIIKRNKLDVFDIIIGGYDVKKLKPDPESIYKIMDFYRDSEVSKYLIVGDSDKDILAGKNAGIKTALFYPNGGKNISGEDKVLKLKPDIVFENWGDFEWRI